MSSNKRHLHALHTCLLKCQTRLVLSPKWLQRFQLLFANASFVSGNCCRFGFSFLNKKNEVHVGKTVTDTVRNWQEFVISWVWKGHYLTLGERGQRGEGRGEERGGRKGGGGGEGTGEGQAVEEFRFRHDKIYLITPYGSVKFLWFHSLH